MQNTLKFKRRVRLARPKTLVFFGIIFLLLPFCNYAGVAYQTGINFTFPIIVLSQLQLPALILILLPIPVGIGLLFVKKWGWWLFLMYSILLIMYNLYVILTEPEVYNIGAIVQSILGCAAVFYFVNKDISAPYMKMYPRGWRGEKRKPLELKVAIDGTALTTRDFSIAGFYVDWLDAPYNPYDAIKVTIPNRITGKMKLDAGVVRVDQNGIGVAFRGLTGEQKNAIKEIS